MYQAGGTCILSARPGGLDERKGRDKMSAQRAADLAVVTDDQRGAEIQSRFKNLGISDRDWYRRTGIDRKTLNRAMEGLASVRPNTYRQIEDWLTKLETEKSGFAGTPHEDESRVVTFRLSGNFGIDVVVSGPVENIDELRQSVEQLIRHMGDNDTKK